MLSDTLERAPDGDPFQFTALHNARGTTLLLMDWGASWLSCRLALGGGQAREVLLGCRRASQYPEQQAFLGATIGRYANRIANAAYLDHGRRIALLPSQGINQLHGGPEGFDKRRWQRVAHDPHSVTYRLHSPDGDQGYPGNLTAETRYMLDDEDRVTIDWQARVDRPCPVGLTNHAYFNLGGDGQADALMQQLQLHADNYLPVDEQGIPCAPLRAVAGSGMDFRQSKTLRGDLLRDVDQRRVKGYDHAFLLQPRCRDGAYPAATLRAEDGRVNLQVYTNAPALQLYSGNYLAGTPDRQGATTPTMPGWRWNAPFSPIARIIPNGLNPAACCNPAQPTTPSRSITSMSRDATGRSAPH
ncbi:Aldose 1-epimerase [Edwardsiella tarda]|nr:Aldose 1-epimerase [Edwardsiella tarda]